MAGERPLADKLPAAHYLLGRFQCLGNIKLLICILMFLLCPTGHINYVNSIKGYPLSIACPCLAGELDQLWRERETGNRNLRSLPIYQSQTKGEH